MSADLKFHPLADIFPLMEGEDFDALVADIKAHGLREPIVVYENQILDGRNRARACEVAGVEPTFIPYMDDDPLGFVISANLRRRHLDASQRAMVAAKLATLKLGDNQHSEGLSIDRASDLLNVGVATAHRAREVIAHGAPELAQAVDRGEVAVSAAAEVATLPEPEQREVLAEGGKAVAVKAKALRKKRAGATAKRKRVASKAEPDLAKVNWRWWSSVLGPDRVKQIRGTCLATEKELGALIRLNRDVQEKLIADAASGKTVSAAALWEALKTEAEDLAAKLISRSPDEVRRLREIVSGDRAAHVRSVFVDALLDGIDKLDGAPAEEDCDDEEAA